MGKRLNRIRSNSILGFTVQEMLILLTVFSVLGVFVYFWFIEQQKPTNDSKTYRTVDSAITVVDEWVASQENKDTPVPAIDSLDITLESNVVLELTGTANGYCIIGTNEKGNVAKNTGYVYASIDNDITDDGRECVDGKFIGEAPVEETEETTDEATEEAAE